jgi:hypothetical protein
MFLPDRIAPFRQMDNTLRGREPPRKVRLAYFLSTPLTLSAASLRVGSTSPLPR